MSNYTVDAAINTSAYNEVWGYEMKHRRVIFLLSAYMLAASFNLAVAQSVVDNIWVPNSDVYTVVQAGNTVYLGGHFTYIGPPTGGGAAIDINTGEPDLAFAKVNGTVQAAAPDSLGGWYIGGSFTKVGGVLRNNLARINADGTVNRRWNPNANQQVTALVISGATVYVGGEFDSIGGQKRTGIAAIDTLDGAVTDWNPQSDGAVYTISAAGPTASGNPIYVGGAFDSIGGQSRKNIAALDPITGASTNWNPNADYQVMNLSISGSKIYATGAFSLIGGQLRRCIAALDAISGNATAWNPNPNGNVYGIMVSGARVFVGGSFDSIGGQPRKNVAALDTAIGAATSWKPNPDNSVFVLAMNGTTVYIGGAFAKVGGNMRNYIAAVDTMTGEATGWNPGTSGWTGVLAIYGSTVYAGGAFTSVGGLVRNGVAAIDLTTGKATSWDPKANGTVYALAVSGSKVYAGGEFTNIGDKNRYYIASLDRSAGSATDWYPYAYGYVYALAVSGATVYAGGILGSPSSSGGIAAFDTTTGSLRNGLISNGHVYAFAVSETVVYAGGNFSGIGEIPFSWKGRNNIAAIDTATGWPTEWNPGANGGVFALTVSDSIVYAGGNFNVIDGQTRHNVAALGAQTGNASNWNPDANSTVQAIAVVSGSSPSRSTVYVGGDFTNIGGQTRNHLAELDAATGMATNWSLDADGDVWGLAVSDSTISVGGVFREIGITFHPYFAVVRRTITSVVESPKKPEEFTLYQNYPNPFNPNTTIAFVIGHSSFVSLRIYDVLGREVANLVNEEKPPGEYRVRWDASRLASGIYFYRIAAGTFINVKKMLLMK
jgi:trimeric autotransporter adhesin